ncbi:MAG: thioredoxin [Prevotellaceae bacterium]|nr:thioredoxin [Candidatus Faecinaster equi]
MEIEFTDQNFAEYAAMGKPMMIDFSASWCGPCKKMGPIVENLANKYEGQILIGKCDVDENSELVEKFGIRNIPAIMFIKGGELVDKTIGALPESDIETKLKSLL